MCKFEGSTEMCSNYGLVQASECLAKHTVSLSQAIVTGNAALATSGQQHCDGIRKHYISTKEFPMDTHEIVTESIRLSLSWFEIYNSDSTMGGRERRSSQIKLDLQGTHFS